MPTLQAKVEELTAGFSPDERALIEGAGPDADPTAFPPEVQAKLRQVAEALSPEERAEFLASIADDDPAEAGEPSEVEGHMINLDRPYVPPPGQEPTGGGGGKIPGLIWKHTPGLGNGLEPAWQSIKHWF